MSRGARPIRDSEVQQHYHTVLVDLDDVSLDEYTDVWRDWISYSRLNQLDGLDRFHQAHYTQGTTQTFDHFVIRHRNRTIATLAGEFQYHNCISKRDTQHRVIDLAGNGFGDIDENCAVLISCPFSDYGIEHPRMRDLLDYCEANEIPVCLDLAYWPIARYQEIDLNEWTMIEDVTFSLSKAFAPLERHRVGVRFSRKYHDDGICMLNEVKMYNEFSMMLGVEFMRSFPPDYNWNQYGFEYERICHAKSLITTDTVIFGLGDGSRYPDNNRGVPGNYRVCISEELANANH